MNEPLLSLFLFDLSDAGSMLEQAEKLRKNKRNKYLDIYVSPSGNNYVIKKGASFLAPLYITYFRYIRKKQLILKR
jgi:hypothetical protein